MNSYSRPRSLQQGMSKESKFHVNSWLSDCRSTNNHDHDSGIGSSSPSSSSSSTALFDSAMDQGYSDAEVLEDAETCRLFRYTLPKMTNTELATLCQRLILYRNNLKRFSLARNR